MFNRSYHLRAKRGGLVPVGEVLQELVDAADAGRAQHFYRPTSRPNPVPIKKTAKPAQLELFGTFHVEQPAYDPDRPLSDLFPGAYSE